MLHVSKVFHGMVEAPRGVDFSVFFSQHNDQLSKQGCTCCSKALPGGEGFPTGKEDLHSRMVHIHLHLDLLQVL